MSNAVKNAGKLYNITDAVADFGAVGDGVADDTAAIQAAATSLAATGGTVSLSPGTFKITGLITLPTNVSLHGAGNRATFLKQYGAAFAVKMGGGSTIKGIGFRGTASATGAIDCSNVGIGEIDSFDIQDFTATNAVAIKVHETYRLEIGYGYIFNCYTDMKFSGNVTTLLVNKVNFGVSAYRSIDCSGGSGDSFEGFFTGCYFESSTGNQPIYFNATGRVVFDKCGFESMCGSGANPRMATFLNPMRAAFKSCQFSGWDTTSYSYTGTANVVYMGDDAPMVDFDDCDIIQNAALSGATFYFLRVLGVWTGVGMNSIRCYGSAFASDLDAAKYLLGGMDATYFPRSFSASNIRVRSAYLGQRVSPSDSIPATVIASGASTLVWSKQFPARSFGPGSFLRITAWGRRTGTAGTKRALLSITDSVASSWLAAPAISAATDWRSEITVQFFGPTSQSISVVTVDGAATAAASYTTSKDTLGYDPIFALYLECASGGDTMTLDGLILQHG